MKIGNQKPKLYTRNIIYECPGKNDGYMFKKFAFCLLKLVKIRDQTLKKLEHVLPREKT